MVSYTGGTELLVLPFFILHINNTYAVQPKEVRRGLLFQTLHQTRQVAITRHRILPMGQEEIE